jgi:Flp pilus assembly pilin Flp
MNEMKCSDPVLLCAVGSTPGFGPDSRFSLFHFYQEISMSKFNRKFAQQGQGMTEYIIIVALIAVAAIGVYSYFGQTVKSQTSAMAAEMAGKSASTGQTAAAGASDKAASSVAKGASNLGNYGNEQK